MSVGIPCKQSLKWRQRQSSNTHTQAHIQTGQKASRFYSSDAARIIYGRFRGAFLGRQAQHALRVGQMISWRSARCFRALKAFQSQWAFFMGFFREIVGGFWQNSFAAAWRRERLGSAATLLEWTPSLGLSYAKNVRDLRTMAWQVAWHAAWIGTSLRAWRWS